MGKRTRIKQEENKIKNEKCLTFLKSKNNVVKKDKKLTYIDLKYLIFDEFKTFRDPNTWSSKSFNEHRQKVDFIKHCFCKYNIPSHIINGYIYYSSYDKNSVMQAHKRDILLDWIYNIGQGNSFKKCCYHPFDNNKELIYFLTAKHSTKYIDNINKIIINSKLKTSNIDEKFIDCIITNTPFHTYQLTDLKQIFKRDSTFCSLLNFINKYNDILTKETLVNILDFYKNNKDISYNRRTLNSVMRLVDDWHIQLNENTKNKKIGNIQYTKKLDDYIFQDKNFNDWKISQIKSYHELINESKKMHHCVISYHSLIMDNTCSIYSLSLNGDKEITIEIDKTRSIVQCRGRYNKLPNKEQINIIKKWAKVNNLRYIG